MPKEPIIESPHTWGRAPAKPMCYPLDECYARHGRKLPDIEAITGAKIPEPYKSLLVHNTDMTSTLERFHGARIHLMLLHRSQSKEAYFREVILTLDGSNKRVEFGAIKINLVYFEPAARQKILEEHLPLGRILHEHKVAYHSNPRSFLKIQPDDFIRASLDLAANAPLYARCNVLSNPLGQPLAEIVEILPP